VSLHINYRRNYLSQRR